MPIKEIKTLYNSSEHYKNIKTSCNNDFSVRLKDTPYIFKIEGMNNDCGVTEMQVFGRKIQFNLNKNEITVGKNCAPITLTATKNNITIIVDRCSIEIFADGGKIYMSCLDNDTLCDRNIPYFVIKSDNETTIEAMEIHSLNSIWR